MKKAIVTLFLFSTVLFELHSQNDEIQVYIDQGIQLHDNGNYKGAVEIFNKALAIDKNSTVANYEISSTYFALNNYEKAIEHSNIVIAAKPSFADQAYIVKGSALDMLGKSKEAIKTYKEAISNYPSNYLLYYNLAYTEYNLKDYKEAEKALENALKNNPNHASSHLLLSYVMSDQGNRVKTILALYNFLLIEPKGKRAKSALSDLDVEIKKGVKMDGKEINISISDTKGNDDFRQAELMLSLFAASEHLDKNVGKSNTELFCQNTKSFFQLLGEIKKKKKGFWWSFYVDFFYSLGKDNQVEPFCYFISQSAEDEKISAWIRNNSSSVEHFQKWNSNYKRK